MVFPRQNPQISIDSIETDEKKETNVSVVPVLSPLDSGGTQEQLKPRGWPDQPEQLAVSRLYEFGMGVYDALLSALTLALAAKTSLCIFSYEKNCTKWNTLVGYRVDGGSALAATILLLNQQITTAFTIAFITIVATVTRRYALWKAQRGAYVSDLEQLYGSISLPSTIKLIFVLRKFTLSSLLLVVVWSFYYLGSQASAREYVYALSAPHRAVRGLAPGDGAMFDFSTLLNTSEWGGSLSYINDLFKMSEDFDDKQGLDANGYLLIPEMRYNPTEIAPSPSSTKKSDEELQQWMSCAPEPIQKSRRYISAAGRRVYVEQHDLGLAPNDNLYWNRVGTDVVAITVIGEYEYTTSHMTVECDSVQAMGLESMPLGIPETTKTSINMSSAYDHGSIPAHTERFDVWHRWNHDELCLPAFCNDTFLIDGADHGVIRIGCTITRPQVRIKAKCPGGGGCFAESMRYLPTFSSNPFANATWASGFFDNILQSKGPAYSQFEGDTKFSYDLHTEYFSMLIYNNESTTSQLFEFGYQLTKDVNTYFNLADWYADDIPLQGSDYPNWTSFTLSGAYYFPQYRLLWAWIALDYVSTVILFAASILSFWLRKRTLAPDIFGYVSSLTRDNPYVPVTAGGSSLSGLDRAKALQKVKIKIADVPQGDGVSKVGVVYMDGDTGINPLSKDRKYL